MIVPTTLESMFSITVLHVRSNKLFRYQEFVGAYMQNCRRDHEEYDIGKMHNTFNIVRDSSPEEDEQIHRVNQ